MTSSVDYRGKTDPYYPNLSISPTEQRRREPDFTDILCANYCRYDRQRDLLMKHGP